MKVADNPKNEKERLDALKLYQVLDTLPEQSFDDLTLIASQICETPIALVSLIDESRQWFKSRVGLNAAETPRDIAFCSHAILQDEVFEIPNSFEDERFKDNPLAIEAPNVRFYAGAPLKTPSGYNIGTLCVIDHIPRDLTKEQLESLEALARQVVSLLELKASQRKSETASSAKSMFLANMSHEIRTPLSGVLSFTDLLLEMDLPNDALEQVGYIKDSSECLLTIVNDILDISKIEANKLELVIGKTNIKEILIKSCSVFKAIAKKKNVELIVEVDDNTPDYIAGDEVRIRQIILNLVSNAIKFTNAGSVKVKLKKEKCVKNSENYLILEVQDSGIGIPEDSQSRVFEIFEQETKGIRRNFGGTGLGLPICSTLAKLMGGRIELKSTQGKGSLFSLVIPISEIFESVSESEENRIDRSAERAKLVGRELKILIAEDNELNQKILLRLLSKFGQDDVDVVFNGEDCIKKAQENDYDLILMDIQMPVMDGLEATKIIKKNTKKTIQIIGLSANAYEKDKKLGRESGMDHYLEKPINFSKLEEVLSKVSS